MSALLIVSFFVALALAAPRWGHDSHHSGEWGSDPKPPWQRPDIRSTESAPSQSLRSALRSIGVRYTPKGR
jgi:hypothetical protein